MDYSVNNFMVYSYHSRLEVSNIMRHTAHNIQWHRKVLLLIQHRCHFIFTLMQEMTNPDPTKKRKNKTSTIAVSGAPTQLIYKVPSNNYLFRVITFPG